jgi:type IX secretion system PorP/SprF family membrane protein
MRLFIKISLFLLISNLCIAQDIHFSQFYAAPLILNPALTGNFDGDVRFAGNQRTQWRSVTRPYKTFGGSVDFSNLMAGVSGGVHIFHDKTGDSEYSTLQAGFAGAYSRAVDTDARHKLSIGFLPTFTQRKINYDNLSFDNQFNGSYYDPNLGTGENFARPNLFYFNLHLGLGWDFKIDDTKKLTSGATFFNINKPKQSLFDNTQIKLDRRFLMHSMMEYKLNEQFDLLPGLLFMRQGTYTEFLLGGLVKYNLATEGPFQAVYGGLWSRMGDAGFVTAGVMYDSWNVGVSYDINYSNLVPASRYRGALEFSVIYIFKKRIPEIIRHRICPTFI